MDCCHFEQQPLMSCAFTCVQVVHRHRARHGTPDSLACRPMCDSPASNHPMLVIVSLTSAARRVRLRGCRCSPSEIHWLLSMCRHVLHPCRPAQCKSTRQEPCLPPVHSLFLAHRAYGARSERCARSDDVCARVFSTHRTSRAAGPCRSGCRRRWRPQRARATSQNIAEASSHDETDCRKD